MQFRLRTLHILLGIGPPALAVLWFWTLPAIWALGTALTFWIMPKTFTVAIIVGIGIGNGVGFMLVGVLAQWWYAAYIAKRAKHSK